MDTDSDEEVFQQSSNMSTLIFDADGYIIEYGAYYYPSLSPNYLGEDVYITQ